MELGQGSYSVTSVQHCVKTLNDGTKIAMKVFLPCKKNIIKEMFPCFLAHESLIEEIFIQEDIYPGEKFATILEYLPYSKDGAMTLSRDYARLPWFASHGYIIIRIDMRGSGASSGFYFDEYDQQEFDDCVEIIEWIESKPWSNGNVGMYGKSWGGFNGLQVAYKQPKALKAVISVYSTDNRFSNDVHYQGGALVGNGIVSWANFMFTQNARPPPPSFYENLTVWRKVYKERLEVAGQSFLSTWLHHQHESDPYWLHGSIKTDHSKIKCAVLAIGGHADVYRNSAFRMACSLNDDSRVILGPWSHQWPDTSPIGPKIDYTNVCLNWWDFHLKNIPERSTERWPRVQIYLLDSIKPCDIFSDNPGRWVNIPHWKSKMDCSVENDIYFYLYNDFNLKRERSKQAKKQIQLSPHVMQGSNAGISWPLNHGFPGDQNVANANSLCWKTEPLKQDIIILGMPQIDINYCTNNDGKFCIQARVCDELPSGESMLITKGCQNVSISNKGWVDTSQRGTTKKVSFNLNSCAKIVRAGHKLLVALSPTSFPSTFPSISVKGLNIFPTECALSFKTLTDEELRDVGVFEKPRTLLKYPVEIKELGSFKSGYDKKGDLCTFSIEDKSDLKRFPRMKYTYQETFKEKYITDQIVSFCDIIAESMSFSQFEVNNESINVKVETKQTLEGNKNHFKIVEDINVKIKDELLFAKTWDNVIPRKYV